MEHLELFEKNTKLVVFLVNKYHGHLKDAYYSELEDIYQEGFLGLWKAARTFKPEKGIAFSSYAARCITNQTFMYLRKLKTRQKLPVTMYLDQPIKNQIDETNTDYYDVIGKEGNVDSDLLAYDLLMFYENENNTTPYYKKNPIYRERHKELFQLMIEGHTQREIGNILGISQSYVSRFMKKMKEEIYQCIYE